MGFVFTDEKGQSQISSEIVSNWIFRKAFEDVIIGLTLSLIQAYTLLEIKERSQRSTAIPFESAEAIQNEIDKIGIQARKLPFPALIDNIESHISDTLFFKEEIISINQIRNCLVHKNGIVQNAQMSLKYIDSKVSVKTADSVVELTKEVKDQNIPIQGMSFEEIRRENNFRAGDKVQISSDMFKAITYTCIRFVHEMIRNLPIPEDQKTSLIQPMMATLVIK